MKREIAVSMLIASVMVAALVHCTGCLSREAKEAIADKTYAAEHLACVDKHDTREEIDACRAAVRVRWGIAETIADGGRDAR